MLLSVVVKAQPSPPSALGRSRASPECDFYGGNKGLVYRTVIRAYAVHVVSPFLSASLGPRRALGDIHW